MARILIIKLGALGDIIIASAAIQQLLQQHRDDQVELLTSTPFADLFTSFFPQLNVIALPRRGGLPQLRLGWHLRRRHYQRIYDLQGNDRSRALTFLINPQLRIGLWPGWPYQISSPLAREQKQHPFRRINSMLQAADVAPADERLPRLCSDSDREKVRAWLQQHQLDQCKRVLIHAGCSARWPSKRWPETAFVELARLLDGHGMAIIWIGGPDESVLNARLSAEIGINAGGEFTITELVALAEQAAFAISNDSGPMHIMSSANIPIYSFFGPTRWQLSHAVGQAERALTANLDCSPCFQRQCPLPPTQHHRCMTELTPQQVLTRLQADNLL